VIKFILCGVTAGALLTAQAALAAPRGDAPAWIVTPAADSCRTDLELTGASGAVSPVTLMSDGGGFELLYAKADAPERAFLPIRVDHKPFPNLVLRQGDGRAAMPLSPETVAALRKGGVLQIGWLGEEPLQTRLAGSEQGLSDLKICGAQVAARFREQQAARRDAQAKADAEARAQAISAEQIAAATAQKDAANAEARRNSAEADRLQAAADAERARVQAEAEAARQRAEDEARTEAYPYARANGGYADPQGRYYAPDPYGGYDPPPPYRRW
jgi:hypothetical protein